MNKVLIAQKKAQANTITRREETASTRSLLNTAKLMGENEMLNKNEFVKISDADDDMKHIQEHGKAEASKARDAHIKSHYDAYIAKSKNPNIQEEVAALDSSGPTADNMVEGVDLSNQNSVNVQSVFFLNLKTV